MYDAPTARPIMPNSTNEWMNDLLRQCLSEVRMRRKDAGSAAREEKGRGAERREKETTRTDVNYFGSRGDTRIAWLGARSIVDPILLFSFSHFFPFLTPPFSRSGYYVPSWFPALLPIFFPFPFHFPHFIQFSHIIFQFSAVFVHIHSCVHLSFSL